LDASCHKQSTAARTGQRNDQRGGSGGQLKGQGHTRPNIRFVWRLWYIGNMHRYRPLWLSRFYSFFLEGTFLFLNQFCHAPICKRAVSAVRDRVSMFVHPFATFVNCAETRTDPRTFFTIWLPHHSSFFVANVTAVLMVTPNEL